MITTTQYLDPTLLKKKYHYYYYYCLWQLLRPPALAWKPFREMQKLQISKLDRRVKKLLEISKSAYVIRYVWDVESNASRESVLKEGGV